MRCVFWSGGGEIHIGVSNTVPLSSEVKLPELALGSDLRNATDILSRLRLLRNEIDCRIEHGVDCGGHLTYVMSALESIIKEAHGQSLVRAKKARSHSAE